jgi:Asp-tRNA(Asn)/Glu-tRNA(Gln) amidotransferase A subunit family amidase
MSADLVSSLRTDVVAAARAIAAGEVTSAALVEACLARAAEVEPWLHAFAWLDADRTRRLAAEADGRRQAIRERGGGWPLLHGVPIGVKDIIDTAGVPTEHGSALFRGRVPERSAAVVEALERAGALVFGKTVTAELAFFHPGPTVNPWNPARTPGGSSMGSAAAVAAGLVPGAVGTQTNGSVIRPAAFCGVVGFKPTAGRLSRAGMLTFSQTLDQVGGFARTVEGAARLAAAMAGEPLEAWWAGPYPGAASGAAGAAGRRQEAAAGAAAGRAPAPRFAAVRTGEWERAEPAMQARFEADLAALAAAGAVVEWPEDGRPRGGECERLPAGLDDALPVHRTIMAFEAAQALGPVVAERPNVVSDVLRAFLAEGARIPAAVYQAALRERERLVGVFASWAAPLDAVLTPPAVGEAPGPETTGDPRFCTRWTLVGAPALVLPTGLGPVGLPLGLQLVGAPGADRRLLAAAAWAADELRIADFTVQAGRS